jgi:hypothetical protein
MMGRYPEAEPLMEEAYRIDAAGNAPAGLLAMRLSNLAMLQQKMGHTVSAEGLMRKAIGLDEHSGDKDGTQRTVRLNNLGTLLYHVDRAAESIPLFRSVGNKVHQIGKRFAGGPPMGGGGKQFA